LLGTVHQHLGTAASSDTLPALTNDQIAALTCARDIDGILADLVRRVVFVHHTPRYSDLVQQVVQVLDVQIRVATSAEAYCNHWLDSPSSSTHLASMQWDVQVRSLCLAIIDTFDSYVHSQLLHVSLLSGHIANWSVVLLCIVVLCCVVLCCVVLCCAVLCCAVLCCAVSLHVATTTTTITNTTWFAECATIWPPLNVVCEYCST
jgi:hypothetical protein